MGSGCCKRKKQVEDGEAAPLAASDPQTDPEKEDQPKFILVKRTFPCGFFSSKELDFKKWQKTICLIIVL